MPKKYSADASIPSLFVVADMTQAAGSAQFWMAEVRSDAIEASTIQLTEEGAGDVSTID